MRTAEMYEQTLAEMERQATAAQRRVTSLEKELIQKDETINALADALEHWVPADGHHEDCVNTSSNIIACSSWCREARSALRLAGRFK